MKINKLCIEFLILLFMFITFCLCISFSLYYITPSNYKLYDFNENNKIVLTKEYTIGPNKNKKIKGLRYPNKMFRIFTNELEYVAITLENKFKSENIYVNKNNLIKLVNSNLIIKNNTTATIKVTVEIYEEIKL